MSNGLLLAGNAKEEHVGSHFLHAARELGLDVNFADVREAEGGPLVRRFCWHFMKHRPGRLGAFSQSVVRMCAEHAPRVLLTTGFAPITAAALRQLRAMGIRRMNYLTDDPWNPTHSTPWFFAALREYDDVFSTRRANMGQLREAGCKRVSYLPFAFAPHLYHPESSVTAGLESDILFAGGADADRVPYIAALAKAGFKVGLYGGYWERYEETRGSTRGLQPPSTVRAALAATKIALCLVRRANRDGTCMRTFEVPAVGACMLVEKTDEHLDLFGPEGEAVVYFENIPEMIEKTRWLLAHEGERARLKNAAHRLITGGGHTYRDRLASMMDKGLSPEFGPTCSAGHRFSWPATTWDGAGQATQNDRLPHKLVLHAEGW
jgi:hypothetical protein